MTLDPLDLPRPLLTVTVYGTPAPQGSKTRTRFGMRESSANVAPWREAVKQAALTAQQSPPWPKGSEPSTFLDLDEPLRLDVTFYMPAPKRHKCDWPATRPDLSKLIRSTEDALTDAGVWVDDSRVVEVRAVKTYAGVRPPGAYIVIYSHGGAT